MIFFGSSVWAYVIGSACGIVATLDPARIEYRQTIDELNSFCKHEAFATDFTVRLRSYFRERLQVIRSQRYDALMQRM